jgi:hypothetical protein
MDPAVPPVADEEPKILGEAESVPAAPEVAGVDPTKIAAPGTVALPEVEPEPAAEPCT